MLIHSVNLAQQLYFSFNCQVCILANAMFGVPQGHKSGLFFSLDIFIHLPPPFLSVGLFHFSFYPVANVLSFVSECCVLLYALECEMHNKDGCIATAKERLTDILVADLSADTQISKLNSNTRIQNLILGEAGVMRDKQSDLRHLVRQKFNELSAL